jgi:hypothetical protein
MVVSLLASVAGLATGADASNYPPDYCDQTVSVVHRQHALLAQVGGGCGSYLAIGYKAAGPLARGNPDFIDAVVVGECAVGTEVHRKTSVVRLGREWHGTGYMSEARSPYSFAPEACAGQSPTLGLAFTDGVAWDSRDGANYLYAAGDFRGPEAAVFDTNTPGTGDINLPAWSFIIEQMRR